MMQYAFTFALLNWTKLFRGLSPLLSRKLEQFARSGLHFALRPALIKQQSGTVIGFRDVLVMNGMFLSWTKGTAAISTAVVSAFDSRRRAGCRGSSSFCEASGLLHATVAYRPSGYASGVFLEPLLRSRWSI